MRPAMKPTFLTYQKPLLTSMILRETPEECINLIMNSLYDGAEAFGFQMEYLKREYRTPDTLKKIFSYCDNRPIYITSYRGMASRGYTDEECVEYLLMGLEAGATLCDVMGDLYHQDAHDMTYDPEAVKKQKALIARIHDSGGEVLMSSHIRAYFDEEQVVAVAKEHQARGADIAKIVNHAQTEEQLMQNLHMAYRLKQELDIHYLLLANGPYCRLLRQVGPELGVCMYLCVQHYGPGDSKEQPNLKALKIMRDHMA